MGSCLTHHLEPHYLDFLFLVDEEQLQKAKVTVVILLESPSTYLSDFQRFHIFSEDLHNIVRVCPQEIDEASEYTYIY